VGRRASTLPTGSPAVASSLYLFAYYLGSSVGGAVGGVAYDHGGWPAVLIYVTGLFAAALVLAVILRRIKAP
jgi:MFS transporter, YNFM family, putative membrane transport protein